MSKHVPNYRALCIETQPERVARTHAEWPHWAPVWMKWGLKVTEIIKDKICTMYAHKDALLVVAARWFSSGKRILSLGKERKLRWEMKTRRGYTTVFFSGIKSPFWKDDFACIVIPMSSRAAKADDLMGWSWGRSKQVLCDGGNN